MATNNSINDTAGNFTIDPKASSDSFVQFNINTTGEFKVGVDDNDSDSFKMSQGSALGTNDRLIIDTSGYRTMPIHPSFYAEVSTAAINVTGDGTTYGPIIFQTERFDQGSNYNSSTGVFTAPVDGRYFFTLNIPVKDITSSSFNSAYFSIVTSNRTYSTAYCDPHQLGRTTQYILAQEEFCDMDSGDTAYAAYTVSGGTKTIDTGSGNATTFSGYLAC